jgi:tRNA 2-thiouridine synthesizing protein A
MSAPRKGWVLCVPRRCAAPGKPLLGVTIEGPPGGVRMAVSADRTIDVVGKSCPIPLIALAKEVRSLRAGQTVRITGNDPIFEESIVEFCRTGSHELLETTREGRVVSMLIRV